MAAVEHFSRHLRSLAVVMAALHLATAHADLADELADLVGYTIVATKTIEGWKEARKSGDDFEGCEFDRVILFTDGTALVCREYSYSYSFMPTAVILAKQITYQGRSFYDFKMVVDDEVYDMGAR